MAKYSLDAQSIGKDINTAKSVVDETIDEMSPEMLGIQETRQMLMLCLTSLNSLKDKIAAAFVLYEMSGAECLDNNELYNLMVRAESCNLLARKLLDIPYYRHAVEYADSDDAREFEGQSLEEIIDSLGDYMERMKRA